MAPLKTSEHTRHQAWEELLARINKSLSSSCGSQGKKPSVFISYAWEPEAGNNAELQAWLKRVQGDLLDAGVDCVFLDVTSMNNKMSDCMRDAVLKSDAAVVIGTPQYLKRAQDPTSGVAFELEVVLQQAAAGKLQVLPLLYAGDINTAFPETLRKFLVRDVNALSYEDLLVALDSPLGLIPALFGVRPAAATTSEQGGRGGGGLGGIGGGGGGGGGRGGARGGAGNKHLEYVDAYRQYQSRLVTRIPPVNSGFCGRQDVLEALRSSLLHDQPAAVAYRQTISGLGGVGKTQLALAYAHKYADQYQLCRWMSAEGKQANLELERFARDLKVEVEGVAPEVWKQELFKVLHSISSWLLIFDNAESASALAANLPSTYGWPQLPGQHILITSRSQRFPRVLNVDGFKPKEVWTYLSTHLEGSSITVKQSEAELLGNRLAYLPLAIAQAAAYMRSCCIGIPTYVKLLDQIPEVRVNR